MNNKAFFLPTIMMYVFIFLEIIVYIHIQDLGMQLDIKAYKIETQREQEYKKELNKTKNNNCQNSICIDKTVEKDKLKLTDEEYEVLQKEVKDNNTNTGEVTVSEFSIENTKYMVFRDCKTQKIETIYHT